MAEDFSFTLELDEGYRFLAEFGQDGVAPLLMDEPPPLGEGAGPNAARVLAAAVGNCYGVCPDNAVVKLDDGDPAYPYAYAIDPDSCKGCGLCAEECGCGAIEMEPERI